MHADRAELSSIASALDELTRRVAAIAERERAADPDAPGSALHEVERALATAHRRLEGLLRP
jgi:hypothetical protein